MILIKTYIYINLNTVRIENFFFNLNLSFPKGTENGQKLPQFKSFKVKST